MISYIKALNLTLENIKPLGLEYIDLLDGNGWAVSEEMTALVNSPSLDASLKDGYAIHSGDIVDANPEKPVELKLIGSVAAGGCWEGEIGKGEAVRILSGAPIPNGTDAVVAEEFVRKEENGTLQVYNDACPGRNILFKGSDVDKGQVLITDGELLSPTKIGWIAAAGHHQVQVYKKPRVAILATGDEVIAPGESLSDGKLFASNLVTLAAWCRRFGFDTYTLVVPDDRSAIKENLDFCLKNYDALLSSGGAWKGERDLIVHLLDDMGWKKIYHRVRIGPGKAIGFGLYQNKPVFCLPGGPPSNHMAFLQLALPGLHKFAGWETPGLPVTLARLSEDIRGQIDWTQFVHGKLKPGVDGYIFVPLKPKSRLQMMADTDGIVSIPEGTEVFPKGEQVQIQLLR
jgi:molybdopterin molybdotransferase